MLKNNFNVLISFTDKLLSFPYFSEKMCNFCILIVLSNLFQVSVLLCCFSFSNISSILEDVISLLEKILVFEPNIFLYLFTVLSDCSDTIWVWVSISVSVFTIELNIFNNIVFILI